MNEPRGSIGRRPNLEARIGSQASRATGQRLTVDERTELVDLVALRGHVLGRIADAERAAAMADELVAQEPTDARSVLARARMRGFFHRFAAALADLDTAAALDGDRGEIGAERAAIYQALGRYDEAFAIRRAAVVGRPDFSALAALAGIYGERGAMDEAERWLRRATRRYRSTSPFPLAMLELQFGRLWTEHGDLGRARALVRCGGPPSPGLRPRARAPRQDRRRSLARRQPPSPACGRWRSFPTTRITRRSSPHPGRRRPLRGAQTWRGKAERAGELLARHQDADAG